MFFLSAFFGVLCPGVPCDCVFGFLNIISVLKKVYKSLRHAGGGVIQVVFVLSMGLSDFSVCLCLC